MSYSFTRRPRAVVQVNGDELAGWVQIETEANEFSAPDTFRVIFSMSGLPLDRSAKYWSEVQAADLEVFEGLPTDPNAFTASDLTSMFVGRVDDIEMDWVERLITISGRDLTAKLIDAKTSEKFVNLSASAIAEKLAAKYGLTPKITATKIKAGRFYKTDHVDLQDQRTEWDLLTWLAKEEGFAVYVTGRTLYFGPRPSLDDAPKFIIRRSEATHERTEDTNYVRLQTMRTLTVAGDIKVTVKSWNSKKKRAFTKTARRTGRGSGGPKQEYDYTIPGLTADEAQAKAEAILAGLSRHAMRVEYEGAGRVDLGLADMVLLEGTGSDFDQVYFPERITRTISAGEDGGFIWSISAKNRASDDEPAP